MEKKKKKKIKTDHPSSVFVEEAEHTRTRHDRQSQCQQPLSTVCSTQVLRFFFLFLRGNIPRYYQHIVFMVVRLTGRMARTPQWKMPLFARFFDFCLCFVNRKKNVKICPVKCLGVFFTIREGFRNISNNEFFEVTLQISSLNYITTYRCGSDTP